MVELDIRRYCLDAYALEHLYMCFKIK